MKQLNYYTMRFSFSPSFFFFPQTHFFINIALVIAPTSLDHHRRRAATPSIILKIKLTQSQEEE